MMGNLGLMWVNSASWPLGRDGQKWAGIGLPISTSRNVIVPIRSKSDIFTRKTKGIKVLQGRAHNILFIARRQHELWRASNIELQALQQGEETFHMWGNIHAKN